MDEDENLADLEANELASNAPSPAEPPLVSLTRIQHLSITSVWPTEPHHFTPWLLANSELLSEVLGMDVELEFREHKVGKFSLDIIGREVATGQPVIVENQFGPTDHQHLGQIMTYAGGTKPATVVWVAEQFREEHRAALDWLNAHTDPTVRFFGVQLGAATLFGAPPGLIAPMLELTVKPNDWEKIAHAATAGASGPTPTQELYRAFWLQFQPFAKERGWTSAAPPAANWWNLPTGVSNVIWGVSFAKFGCRSEIYFGHPDPSVNLARWQALKDKEELITGTFGGDLIFDDLPNNKGCRIETRLQGPRIGDQNQWPALIEWFVDTQERLRKSIALAGGVPTDVTAAWAPVDDDAVQE